MTDRRSISNDTVYQFVSDPGHKETLSGRVLAACVNCRRKKMKCSGRMPCATCIEKGLICEGLVARKKPTRSARSSRTRNSEVAATSSSGTMDAIDSRETRKSVGSLAAEPKPTDRPNYATTNLEKMEMEMGIDNMFGDSGRLQPTYTFDEGTTDFVPSGGGSYFHRPPATHSHSAPMTASASQEWGLPDQQSTQSVSSPTSSASTSYLLRAAQSLEQQAQVLRQLAQQQQNDITDTLVPQMAALPAQLESDQSPIFPGGTEGWDPWNGVGTTLSNTAVSQQPRSTGQHEGTVNSWSPIQVPNIPWLVYQSFDQNNSAPSTSSGQQADQGRAVGSRLSHGGQSSNVNRRSLQNDSSGGPYAWNPCEI